MHLKGGVGVQAIRWTFVAFCFLLFVFSVSVLTISAVNYAEMRVAFDELRSQKKYDFDPNHIFNKFHPEPALGIFYFGMVLGTVFTLISCIGSCGAACLERCFLIVFVISFSFVLFGTVITLTVVVAVYKDDLQKLAEELFKEFVNHLYGRGDLMVKIWTRAIDTIQSSHECCGVLESLDAEATYRKYGAYPAQYTTLYWLESTQWGQIQANNIRYNKNETLRWAPDSCCRNRRASCAMNFFGARLNQWNETMEREWSNKIYVRGCGEYLLNFNHLEAAERGKLIALAIVMIVIMLTTIVLACWLCQAVSAYEYSSKESELDQRRHRRRRRRRHRHRRKRDTSSKRGKKESSKKSKSKKKTKDDVNGKTTGEKKTSSEKKELSSSKKATSLSLAKSESKLKSTGSIANKPAIASTDSGKTALAPTVSGKSALTSTASGKTALAPTISGKSIATTTSGKSAPPPTASSKKSTTSIKPNQQSKSAPKVIP